MAEIETQTQPLDGQEQPVEGNPEASTVPKTFTQEEVDALIKERETKAYVKGKTDTTKKWEQKAAEQARLAKEEAEKQAKFANMSEQKKAETERDDYKKQLETLRDQIAYNEQKEETRKILQDKGLSDFFIDAVLVKGDAEATIAKADELKVLIDAEINKAVEAKIVTHIPKQNKVQDEYSFDEEYARKLLKLPPKQ